MALKKQKRGGAVKPTVKKRSLNATSRAAAKPGQPKANLGRSTSHAGSAQAPGQEQDAKRRLGDFTGTGEHARVGSRTAGIIGQTKRAFGTDKKRSKSRGSLGKPDKAR
jgi:hypothetical protein